MKKFVGMSVMPFMMMLLSMTVLFTSCDTENVITPDNDQAALKARTAPPEVPSNLVVPAGHVVSFHTYADGYQVYASTQTGPDKYEWILKEPIATLYASPNFTGVVGTHYVGPYWESNSGSRVKAARIDGATVDPNSIQWLLLGATLSHGPGVFDGTKFIHRVNTVGGKAPLTGAHAGNLGELLYVPYTAEYFFYKPE